MILFLSLLGTVANAQNFRIKGGINFNQLRPINPSPGYSYHPTQGIYVGVLGEIRLTDQLCLLTGLAVSTKSYSYNHQGDNFSMSGENNFAFLEVPLHAQYNFPLWDELSLFIGAGPFLAWDPFWSIWRSETFGDYGLSGSLGLEYQWVQLGAYFDHGLARLRVSQEETIRTQVFSLRLGIKL